MKFICKKISRMSIIFRDESNKSISTIIGYSDATVITPPDHFLIMWSKILLDRARVTVL